MLRMRPWLSVVLVATALAGCMPAAADERYEFLTGETICADQGQVTGQKVTAIFGGDHKLTSVSVRIDATDVELAPDKLFGESYFRDLAMFIAEHPESVSAAASGDTLKLDVRLRPPAEVNSMRLRDRLLPGDGSLSFFISKAVMNLGSDPSDEQLAGLFFAYCGSDRGGAPRCERQFPFHGFRASYEVVFDGDPDMARDRTLRSSLGASVRPCR